MSLFSLTSYTLLALMALAGNSVLCRLALNENLIDANSFTIIRLVSGALFLLGLLVLTAEKKPLFEKPSGARLKKAAYLFIYAACFSIAYLMLGTAAGALILFVSVQLTMLFVQYINGKRSHPLELIGLTLALGSFAAWILPSAQRPDMLGVILMTLAGMAWAFYTLAGKFSQHPHYDTAQNFLYSLVFVITLLPLYWIQSPMHMNHEGVLLAITSGAITSGLGYWLWYKVLPAFSTLSAGVMQLSVPVLAAIGGIIWNQEAITFPFLFASCGILGGIFLVLYSNSKPIRENG